MARVRTMQTKGEKKKTTDLIWHVAVYVRLSREDINDDKNESESVSNQKMILDQFLNHNFDGLYEVVDYYVDDGLTGTDDTRKDFMRMIQDVEQGKVNCMLCKTLSRAFRNYADQGYYLEQYFPLKGVRFISTGDPFVDTFKNPEAISGLEVPISGLMNDRYAAKTSNDVRRTFRVKREKGQFIGAFPAYGYLKDPLDKNHLILDQEIYPIKRDIYGWLIHEGMSFAGAAKKLNELGIPNPTAYKIRKGWTYQNPHAAENDGLWCGTTVRRMMLDKVNLGHMVQGRQRVVSYKVHDKIAVPEDEWFIVENTHEPTFTQEEYDKLEDLCKRDTRTPNDKRNVYLLSGFLRCADCKKAMRRTSGSKSKYVYYICRTNCDKSALVCTRHTIREEELTRSILRAIQTQVSYLESVVSIIDKVNTSDAAESKTQHVEKMLRDKQKDLDRVKSISDGLYADWKNGEITRDEYQRMKVKYREKAEQIAEAIMKLETELQQLSQAINSENAVFKAFLRYRNVQQLNRTILMELVDMVYVHENKKITVQFKFGNELDRIREFVGEVSPD